VHCHRNAKLTPEQQSDILNDPEITEGLPKTYNASKGAKLPEDFVTYKGERLAQDYVAANAERQAVLLKYIQQRINGCLAINLAAKGEADDD
jgi:filamentous hemagglutinin